MRKQSLCQERLPRSSVHTDLHAPARHRVVNAPGPGKIGLGQMQPTRQLHEGCDDRRKIRRHPREQEGDASPNERARCHIAHIVLTGIDAREGNEGGQEQTEDADALGDTEQPNRKDKTELAWSLGKEGSLEGGRSNVAAWATNGRGRFQRWIMIWLISSATATLSTAIMIICCRRSRTSRSPGQNQRSARRPSSRKGP